MFALTPREQKLALILCFLLILGVVLRFTLEEPGSVDVIKNGEDGIEAHGSFPTEEDDDDLLLKNEEAGEVVIHVSGAVKRPGVYTLPEGARVIQALEEAGGALPEADLESVNLAQPLYDGQQARIPFKVEEGDPSGSSAGSGVEVNTSLQNAKININTAERSQLESLPGIGSVKAQGIVHYREQNGPFRQVEDLVKVSGIGDKTLENIKDLITVY